MAMAIILTLLMHKQSIQNKSIEIFFLGKSDVYFHDKKSHFIQFTSLRVNRIHLLCMSEAFIGGLNSNIFFFFFALVVWFLGPEVGFHLRL